MNRELKYYQAINEALDQCMAKDPNVYVMGLGVPDPKGIFGSTLGLEEKYGSDRVMDTPTSENGMTGIAIGSALAGMRPVIVYQRVEFFLLAMEQLVNQAAKWHYMFGGRSSVPLVMRVIIGRGWGQGPQHAQSLQAWFAHIPGLKVVMPTTAYDAKGLLISSIEDNNPVVFLEHRWLYNIVDYVPQEMYRVELGKCKTVRQGNDVTIVATSYMVVEALKAANHLEKYNIHAEIIDVRTLNPLDSMSIINSVRKTGHLIVADTGGKFCGFGSEIVRCVAENAFKSLKQAPQVVASLDYPLPSTPALAKEFYPRAKDIVKVTREMLNVSFGLLPDLVEENVLLDIPDASFTGPF